MLHRMFLACLAMAWKLDDWLYGTDEDEPTPAKEPDRG